MHQNQGRGRLHFTTDLQAAIADAQAVFLALPTPPGADGSADLSAVLAVADQLGEHLGDQYVVINKSTVPVGTADKVRARIAVNHPADFDVVSNPEFLREGVAVRDFLEPDRVVIGTESKKAEKMMRELYTPLVDERHPLLVMDEYSAELSKYASNAFLATKISFINEIANLADSLSADVEAVARAVGADPRIGSQFLQAGIGYGGSCFPKDVLAANQAQRTVFVDKILAHYDGNIAGKHFAVWGLAFKPDTDDIREAPALDVIDALLASGARVTAYDPEAMPNVHRHYESKQMKPEFAADAFSALDGVDALVIATDWKIFRLAAPAEIRQRLATPVIFDGRNIFDPQTMHAAGIIYKSVGRPR